jgi:hypothetical protein
MDKVFLKYIVFGGVADSGYLSRVLIFSILDPGSRTRISGPNLGSLISDPISNNNQKMRDQVQKKIDKN